MGDRKGGQGSEMPHPWPWLPAPSQVKSNSPSRPDSKAVGLFEFGGGESQLPQGFCSVSGASLLDFCSAFFQLFIYISEVPYYIKRLLNAETMP